MSDIINEVEKEASDLMNALDSTELASDAKVLQAMNSMDDLKNEVMGFFKNRISSISRAEHIKDLIFEQLAENIMGGELNFDQKMTVLMRIARDNNESADSIISMFRPNGNTGGSLLTDIIRPGSDKSDIAQAFANYSPEELRKIDSTMRVIRDIVESGGTVSLENSENKVLGTEV